ncbi:MAG: putative metallopeptidase [Patescibacteria group bacterium]
MNWEFAQDIQKQVDFLAKKLSFNHISPKRIFCFRSFGSKSRATARIWSLPRIWQKALEQEPAYCLEVLSERFDRLKKDDQRKTLIHELLHIPKNFSGALLPHRKSRGERFGEKIERLFKNLPK